MITCYLRYQINAENVNDFEEYARRWITLVEEYGGIHHGYFLPHESANDLAVALFSFPSLSHYEDYRLRSATDPECLAAYEFAVKTKCIKRYDREFLRPIHGSP